MLYGWRALTKMSFRVALCRAWRPTKEAVANEAKKRVLEYCGFVVLKKEVPYPINALECVDVEIVMNALTLAGTLSDLLKFARV